MRGDNPEILAQRAPQTEIQRQTAPIRDLPTSFCHKQRARCVVLVNEIENICSSHVSTFAT